MNSKSILQSKTFWANLLGPIFLWLATKGINLDTDTQAIVIFVVMSLCNIGLRAITDRPVNFRLPGRKRRRS